MSISEMLQRFRNGVPLRTREVSEGNFFTVDHDDPNFRFMKSTIDPLIDGDEIRTYVRKKGKKIQDDIDDLSRQAAAKEVPPVPPVPPL